MFENSGREMTTATHMYVSFTHNLLGDTQLHMNGRPQRTKTLYAQCTIPFHDIHTHERHRERFLFSTFFAYCVYLILETTSGCVQDMIQHELQCAKPLASVRLAPPIFYFVS